jgi:putative endonuclease
LTHSPKHSIFRFSSKNEKPLDSTAGIGYNQGVQIIQFLRKFFSYTAQMSQQIIPVRSRNPNTLRTRKSVSTQEKDVLGRAGEQAAAEFLTAKGYRVLQQNLILPGGEIDIAALDDKTLVVVEVKTRKNKNFGSPYVYVTEAKQRRLVRLGGQLMYRLRMTRSPIRFDIVSVTGTPETGFEIEHFENAFRPAIWIPSKQKSKMEKSSSRLKITPSESPNARRVREEELNGKRSFPLANPSSLTPNF